MSEEEFMQYILGNINFNLNETNSVKLEAGKVLLPDVHNERELAAYCLDEVSPFIEKHYGIFNRDSLGPYLYERLGGSFTERGYVFEPEDLGNDLSEYEEFQFEIER